MFDKMGGLGFSTSLNKLIQSMLLKLMFYKIGQKKLSNPIKIKPIFTGCLNVTHKTNAILNVKSKSKLQF